MNWQRLKLMRTAARVQRCHTMTTIYGQSVGEHTFGVITLLLEIWNHPKILTTADADENEARLCKLMTAALYHDATEAITGDTPAPAKWKHPLLEEALKATEKDVAYEFQFEIVLSQHEKNILKYCDLMELSLYAIEEVGTGNTSMAVVFRNAMSAIKERGLIDITPSAHRLFDLIASKYEATYKPNLGSDVTHGWPDYK